MRCRCHVSYIYSHSYSYNCSQLSTVGLDLGRLGTNCGATYCLPARLDPIAKLAGTLNFC